MPKMTTEGNVLTVLGQEVDVVRKRIKNLHLSVYPPDGRVRVACPLHVDDEAVRLAVVRRLGWVRRQQRAFQSQERVPAREYVTGESVYFRGRRYRLLVVEGVASGVTVADPRTVVLTIRKGASLRTRALVMDSWQRADLFSRVPALIAKWEPVIGVSVREWHIQRMERKWGTCNAAAGRIRLNVSLATLPPQCLEYVIVHEMIHLVERGHGERFQGLMDRFLPGWRTTKARMKETPLEL